MWVCVGGGGGAAFTLKRHCNYEKTLIFYLKCYYICGRTKYPKAIVAKKDKTNATNSILIKYSDQLYVIISLICTQYFKKDPAAIKS